MLIIERAFPNIRVSCAPRIKTVGHLFSKCAIWLEITPPFAVQGRWQDVPTMSEARSRRHFASAIQH